MTASPERSLGWLGDLVAQHLFRDGAPLSQRRRWSLDGEGWQITDDTDQDMLRVRLTATMPSADATFASLRLGAGPMGSEATLNVGTFFQLGARLSSAALDVPLITWDGDTLTLSGAIAGSELVITNDGAVRLRYGLDQTALVVDSSGALEFGASNRPVIAGSTGGNAALQGLLAAFDTIGLITNNTT
jgi:hypothetical protein